MAIGIPVIRVSWEVEKKVNGKQAPSSLLVLASVSLCMSGFPGWLMLVRLMQKCGK